MRHRETIYFLLASVMAVGMWTYVQTVLIPCQVVEAARTNAPRGNLSDLYPRWLGAREWFLHGRDPYSSEVTRDIQTGYWGRPVDSRNPGDPKDEARFAYPAYVIFLLAPTILLPFSTVRLVFVVALAVGTGMSVLLWAHGLRTRLKRPHLAIAIVLTLGSWPVTQALLLQQLSLLVATLTAAAVAALASRRLVAAGALLAVATIKPQLVAPAAAWCALWIAGEWRSRWRLGFGFVATLVVLFSASEAIMPGWVSRWIDSFGPYLRYNDAAPLVITLFGNAVGRLLRVGIIAAVAATCWKQRHVDAKSPLFGLTLLLTMVSGLLVMPKWASYDQVLLLPTALWLVHNWRAFRGPVGMARNVCALTMGWQWATALGVSLLALVSPELAEHFKVLPVATTLFLPAICLVTIFGHFWCGIDREKMDTSIVKRSFTASSQDV